MAKKTFSVLQYVFIICLQGHPLKTSKENIYEIISLFNGGKFWICGGEIPVSLAAGGCCIVGRNKPMIGKNQIDKEHLFNFIENPFFRFDLVLNNKNHWRNSGVYSTGRKSLIEDNVRSWRLSGRYGSGNPGIREFNEEKGRGYFWQKRGSGRL